MSETGKNQWEHPIDEETIRVIIECNPQLTETQKTTLEMGRVLFKEIIEEVIQNTLQLKKKQQAWFRDHPVVTAGNSPTMRKTREADAKFMRRFRRWIREGFNVEDESISNEGSE